MEKVTGMLGAAAVCTALAFGSGSAEAATIEATAGLQPAEMQQLSWWTSIRDALLDRDEQPAPPPPPPRRDPPPPPPRHQAPPPPRHQAPPPPRHQAPPPPRRQAPPPPRHQAPPPPRPRAVDTTVEMQQLALTSGMIVELPATN